MKVENRHRTIRLPLEEIRRAARLALRRVGRPRAEVAIRLLSDSAMRSLNRKFHGRDEATDCLAFYYDEEKRRGALRGHVGDIAISLDRARVNARRWHEPFRREVRRYVVHGILHLAGFRDRGPGRSRMLRVQEEILDRSDELTT
ncbi:MAG: rRNA maturation RNase YbeY [Candidatus Omnitrophica bacterium]|nr:rRNA maturation RNase YbeY [Candidatus Omnitrophota bacterium]